MSRGSCHCGATWRQRGNATGHCAACHRTFHGERAFARHFRHTGDAPPECIDPTFHPDYWPDGEGVWHVGPRMDDASKARLEGRGKHEG